MHYIACGAPNSFSKNKAIIKLQACKNLEDK